MLPHPHCSLDPVTMTIFACGTVRRFLFVSIHVSGQASRDSLSTLLAHEPAFCFTTLVTQAPSTPGGL